MRLLLDSPALEVCGGNRKPILLSLSRLRERESDAHSTSRTNHYFRHEQLVWFLENDPNLSSAARNAIEAPDNAPIVSYVSGWETAIKVANGKLALPIPFEELFPAKLEALGFALLPIEAAHLHRLMELPLVHRDPFDRLLIAQAMVEKIKGDARRAA